jgi:hypothetical protein
VDIHRITGARQLGASGLPVDFPSQAPKLMREELIAPLNCLVSACRPACNLDS